MAHLTPLRRNGRSPWGPVGLVGLLGLSAALITLAYGEARRGPAAPAQAHPERKPKPKGTGTTMKDQKDLKDKKELKQKLSPLQYQVTQQNGTEPPFNNLYWNNHEPGLYLDILSGEPLFSSLHKYDSGSGWPSFTRPVRDDAVTTQEDRTHGMVRVEVRSSGSDAHLGHRFEDGPAPTGQRYCINSAALRFVPVDRLAAEGLSDYLPHFGKPTPASETDPVKPNDPVKPKDPAKPNDPVKPKDAEKRETAVLAGGCFWGVEELIRKLPGVLSTTVGYTGGHVPDPTYEIVKTGTSGHAEAIEIIFDPRTLSYEALLEYFFRLHDPTTRNRQGNDRGTQYRSAIFYQNEPQKLTAQAVIKKVEASGRWPAPVVTEIKEASRFYPAEAYHQDYLQRYPDGYTCHYLRD